MVAGAIDSVKIAVIAVLVGAFGVGPGAVVAGTVIVTRGRVVSGGTLVLVAPPLPKICVPPPPPHAAASALSSRTVIHLTYVEQLSIFFIGSLSIRSRRAARQCTQTSRTTVF